MLVLEALKLQATKTSLQQQVEVRQASRNAVGRAVRLQLRAATNGLDNAGIYKAWPSMTGDTGVRIQQLTESSPRRVDNANNAGIVHL